MRPSSFLQNSLPRWNQILTQLRFIHNRVIMGIQWTVRLWVPVQCGGSPWPHRTSTSISSGAQYIVLHGRSRGRKVKMCWFSSGKWFWLSHHWRELLGAGNGRSNILHLPETQSVINRIWLLFSFFWLAHHTD